jgi:hypothetical protein
MTALILAALPIAVSLGAAFSVWVLMRRCAELQRPVVGGEAERGLLQERFDKATALFESRLLRLEGVKGSRSTQRRRAANLVRLGGDSLAIAKQCELPTVELQVLLQLDELREQRAAKQAN